MENALLTYSQRKDRQGRLEHRDAILAIGAILKQKEGQDLFKYLFKNFEVLTQPPREMQGVELHDYLGFLRAGNSIYKLVCQADFKEAANLLSKIEREKYEDELELYNIEHGLNDSN